MQIHTIDLGFLNHQDTIAAYLLVDGDDLALIECGPYSTYPALVKGVESLGFTMSQIKHLFLTHIHFDHAGAAWALAQQGTRIHVHPAGIKHLADPSRLYQSAKQIYGDKMEYLWGAMESIDMDNLYSVEDREVINIGNISLRAWHTPGHAVHHIVWQCADVLITGDVAGVKIGNGPVVPPCPPPDINIEDWVNSINVMRNLAPAKLYLTHYGVIEDVTNQLDSLEKILWDWANWIKPHFDNQTDLKIVTPLFAAYVAEDLARQGITGEHLAQYESANPAWMSVAGLMRYWAKRSQA